jgi:hypothetical protein
VVTHADEYAMQRDADRAIRMLLATYPTRRVEMLKTLAETLVLRSFDLGIEMSSDDGPEP